MRHALAVLTYTQEHKESSMTTMVYSKEVIEEYRDLVQTHGFTSYGEIANFMYPARLESAIPMSYLEWSDTCGECGITFPPVVYGIYVLEKYAEVQNMGDRIRAFNKYSAKLIEEQGWSGNTIIRINQIWTYLCVFPTYINKYKSVPRDMMNFEVACIMMSDMEKVLEYEY